MNNPEARVNMHHITAIDTQPAEFEVKKMTTESDSRPLTKPPRPDSNPGVAAVGSSTFFALIAGGFGIIPLVFWDQISSNVLIVVGTFLVVCANFAICCGNIIGLCWEAKDHIKELFSDIKSKELKSTAESIKEQLPGIGAILFTVTFALAAWTGSIMLILQWDFFWEGPLGVFGKVFIIGCIVPFALTFITMSVRWCAWLVLSRAKSSAKGRRLFNIPEPLE